MGNAGTVEADFESLLGLASAGQRAAFALVRAGVRASWDRPADVRRDFGSADFIADNRVIFDVGGNKYRIVAYVAYSQKKVLIKFVGTHAQHDKIDPEQI